MNLAVKIIFLAILLILLAFFIAPLFFGICNLGNIAGTIISFALILICLKFKIITGLIASLWKSSGGKLLVTILSIIIAIGFLTVIIINIFMIKNVNDYPQNKNSTVIVLGCRVKDGQPSLMLKRRLDRAYDYLSENQYADVIVSGGKGDDEIISEAACMKNYLAEKGIPENKIIMEDKSASTYENLKFSKNIITQNNICSDIVIITDGYHQCRAEMIAKNLGYENVSNISANTSPWLIPTYWVREWFGVAWQFVQNFL